MTAASATAVGLDPARVRLGTLDRLLPVWILLAMALGLVLGRVVPGIAGALDSAKVSGVSLPIAIGLFLMMYPVLAKVRYSDLGRLQGHRRLFGVSLLLNWLVGPVLMFALAWLFLPDLPAYRNGLILIGLARCIAMVLIWNLLARGSNEIAAVLVALNSLFQIVFYSALGWFFLSLVPRLFGASGSALSVGVWDIARNVLVFLGVPLLAAVATRLGCERHRGREWYESQVLPRLGPVALLALLYTIVVMFALQGDRISRLPLDVLRIALPLLVYFVVMFAAAFLLSWRLGFSYEETASLAFTAAGNNFELAIAVAVATFGLSSGEALAGVVGPLVEVPALLSLVYLSLWLRRRLFTPGLGSPAPTEAAPGSTMALEAASRGG